MTEVLLWSVIAAALLFDFVNGFHDAANSIATVVATRVLPPFAAVVWAAAFNFLAFLVTHFDPNSALPAAHSRKFPLLLSMPGTIMTSGVRRATTKEWKGTKLLRTYIKNPDNHSFFSDFWGSAADDNMRAFTDLLGWEALPPLFRDVNVIENIMKDHPTVETSNGLNQFVAASGQFASHPLFCCQHGLVTFF